MNCIRCNSIHCIKYGKRKTQVWKCKKCHKTFQDKPLQDFGLKYDSKIIVYALDLYFNGLSIRKVARVLNDHHDLKTSQSTVYYWIKKYIPKIVQAMSDMMIINNESRCLHVDEMFVKIRNTKHAYKIAYLWNAMDCKTRFLLASQLTPTRSAVYAKYVIRTKINTPHYLMSEDKSRVKRTTSDVH